MALLETNFAAGQLKGSVGKRRGHAPAGQFLPGPPPLLKRVPQDLLGALLSALPPLHATMVAPHLPFHLPQQFTSKFLISQIPPTPHRPEPLGGVQAPPLFHLPFKFPAPRRTVLGNPHLAQKPIHPDPIGPMTRRTQILPVTAPSPGPGCPGASPPPHGNGSPSDNTHAPASRSSGKSRRAFGGTSADPDRRQKSVPADRLDSSHGKRPPDIAPAASSP